MHPLALLVALVLGQSNAAPAAPMLAKYAIVTADGLDVVVEGWKIPANGGKITWEPNRPFNLKAVQDARVASDAANEAAKRDYTDRFGVRHAWPKSRDTPIAQAPRAIPNFGLSPQHMGFQRDHFSTHSEEGRRFVQGVRDAGADVDSIAGKLRVTVIGADADRKRVLDDLAAHPSLVPLKDAILVQDYKPGEWAVDPALGFQAGTPTILIQSGKSKDDPNGGKVLHRAKDYSGGPEKLAEEIRKANPSYKPELDPGIAPGSGSCPLGFTSQHYLPIALAVAALLYLYNQKKGPVHA